MKIIGTIASFSKYIFCITTGTAFSRLDIYSFSLPDDFESQLEPLRLNTKTVRAFNPYILGSAVVTKTGNITKCAGNITIISTVLNLLESTSMMIELSSGAMSAGSYTFDACSLEVIAINSFISGATPIPGLTYTSLKRQLHAGQITAGNQLSKLKTFEELAASRDMSWYIDGNGKCLKDYRLIQSLSELKDVLADAVQFHLWAIDTETTGTDFYWHNGDASLRSKICGMSLSWQKDQGIYIPFMSKVFETLDLKEVMQLLMTLFTGRRLVAHNGMFDFKVLYSYGYYIPITDDTLLMEFNIDPHVQKGSKGLKMLTRKYLHHETIELEELTGGTVIAELIPYIDKELIKVYACADTDYTLQIANLLYPTVKNMPSYQLDCRLIDILAVAEYQGSPVNMEMLKVMSEVNKQDMEIVESIMHKYVHTVGMQLTAAEAIKQVNGQNYIPTEQEILELCNYEPFIERAKERFYKQKKGTTSPLEFSSPVDLAYILYDLLKYPVLKTTDTGALATDKEVLTKLMEYPSDQPHNFLLEDVITSAADFGVRSKNVILSKEKFDSCKYPFAYLLTVWRKLKKFDSSFFGPLLEDSTGGYYFTDNSMTAAETARVINPIQTLEGSLKDLIIPRGDDWYMIVFDKSQIEYRVMLGLAANYWNTLVASGAFMGSAERLAQSKNLTGLIENLNNWEKDYHREGGAIFAGCTPDTMTKKQRKSVKAIHFSVPYGAEAASIAKPKLAGHPESEHADIIAQTEAELAAWRNKLFPLYYFLEYVRDRALEPISPNPPGHYGVYGKVSNALGRYRLFDLSDTSFSKRGSIRRAAGNYPIQSLARDIFFSGVYNLYHRLQNEGVITNNFETSKAVLSIFVHDEVVLQVHKSIHPYRMYKYIMETNLTKLKGHPTYFMGIAVTNNWGEGKTDSYEAPIDYVNDCIKEYDANKEYYDSIAEHEDLRTLDYKGLCLDGITKWFAKRACRELKQTLAGETVIDPVFIHKNLINYYVKSRLAFYSKPCRKSEYNLDPSIDMESNNYLRLFDYYLLLTGEYKNYQIKFNGMIIPYEDILVVDNEENSFDDLAAFDFDVDISEMAEDKLEQEARDIEDYYRCQEDSLAINLYEEYESESEPDPQLEPETNKAKKAPVLWAESPEGHVVFFVDHLSLEQGKKLSRFLHNYIDPNGMPLDFFYASGRIEQTDVKIATNFTKEQVCIAVFGDANGTSYFT